MKYFEIAIHTTDDGIEILTDFLEERGINGTWVESKGVTQEMLEKKNPYDWDYIDEALLHQEDDEAVLTFYLDENPQSESLLSQIKIDLMKLKSDEMYGELDPALKLGRLYLERREIDDESWRQNWAEHFNQVQLTGSLSVKSRIAFPDSRGDNHTIILDPGMAFGTGTHETTALCAVLMEKYGCKDKTVLDIGCGSGILSIAAARMGSTQVIGVDIDPIAVTVAEENVSNNDCTKRVAVREGDLTKGLDIKAELVVANLVAEATIHLAAHVRKNMRKDGIFISSGILLEKENDVVSALTAAGFEIIEIMEKGDWCAIAAK